MMPKSPHRTSHPLHHIDCLPRQLVVCTNEPTMRQRAPNRARPHQKFPPWRIMTILEEVGDFFGTLEEAPCPSLASPPAPPSPPVCSDSGFSKLRSDPVRSWGWTPVPCIPLVWSYDSAEMYMTAWWGEVISSEREEDIVGGTGWYRCCRGQTRRRRCGASAR